MLTKGLFIKFLVSLTIVNENPLLTTVNETNFIKTVIIEKNLHATLLNVVLHKVKKL